MLEHHLRVSASIENVNEQLMKIRAQYASRAHEQESQQQEDMRNNTIRASFDIGDLDESINQAGHFANLKAVDEVQYSSQFSSVGRQQIEQQSDQEEIDLDEEELNKADQEGLVLNNEMARNIEILLAKNAILENELLVLRRRSSEFGPTQVDQDLQAALIEKIRLEELLEYTKEETMRVAAESRQLMEKVERLEQITKEQTESEQEVQKQSQSQHKRLEEQLKHSNFLFVSAQRKIDGLEKSNKELEQKLAVLEQEKRKISQKWSAASQKGKLEEKLKCRVKELENVLVDKTNESEGFKRKYVSTNTELRVYKEGEYNYKDAIEHRFKELRDHLQAEILQKDELLKQNKDLLSQLQEFSQEFTRLQQKMQTQSLEQYTATNQHQRSSKNQLSRVTEASASENEESEVLALQQKLQLALQEVSNVTLSMKQSEVNLANLLGENKLLAVQIKHLREALTKSTAAKIVNEQQTQPSILGSNMYHSFLSNLAIICDAELFEALRNQLNQLIDNRVEQPRCIRCYQQSEQQQSIIPQDSYEAKYFEIKRLYDRLLAKHQQLQHLQLQEQKQGDLSVMHTADRKNGAGVNRVQQQQQQLLNSWECSPSCTTNLRLSSSLLRTTASNNRKSNESGLMQDIPRNDTMSQSQQKMLSSILSRSFESSSGGVDQFLKRSMQSFQLNHNFAGNTDEGQMSLSDLEKGGSRSAKSNGNLSFIQMRKAAGGEGYNQFGKVQKSGSSVERARQ